MIMAFNRQIVVQGEKKNLGGKYIERIGYWIPSKRKTVPRSMVLNRHKARYWLSVGAEPSNGVQRVLTKFGFWPKPPIPFGNATAYETPTRYYE